MRYPAGVDVKRRYRVRIKGWMGKVAQWVGEWRPFEDLLHLRKLGKVWWWWLGRRGTLATIVNLVVVVVVMMILIPQELRYVVSRVCLLQVHVVVRRRRSHYALMLLLLFDLHPVVMVIFVAVIT